MKFKTYRFRVLDSSKPADFGFWIVQNPQIGGFE
jgi:hypothetical protein